MLIGADRERIARDLHDLVIQRLFAAGMTLRGVLGLIDDDRALERVSCTIDELDTTIRDIRTAIFTLKRPQQDGSGLRAQILDLATHAHEGLGFEPHVHFSGSVDTATPDHIASHLIAVVRETLSNVTRHAHATRVDVDLTIGDTIDLVVEDNGIGLGDTTRSSGLANLRERAESLDGAFTITSPPGGGTRLAWQVPHHTSSHGRCGVAGDDEIAGPVHPQPALPTDRRADQLLT